MAYISRKQLKKLRKINEARCPGEWHFNDFRGEIQNSDADPVIGIFVSGGNSIVEITEEDMAFVAAASASFGDLLDIIQNQADAIGLISKQHEQAIREIKLREALYDELLRKYAPGFLADRQSPLDNHPHDESHARH